MLKLGLAQQRLAAPAGPAAGKGQGARRRPRRLRAPHQRQGVRQPPAGAPGPSRAGQDCAALGDGNSFNTARQRAAPLHQRSAQATSNVAPHGADPAGDLLRVQNKAAEAADVLAKSREVHEPNLAKDRPSAPTGSPCCAITMASPCARPASSPRRGRSSTGRQDGRPSGPKATEAALRLGQCLKDEGQPSPGSRQASCCMANPEGSRPGPEAARGRLQAHCATPWPISKARPSSSRRARRLQEVRGPHALRGRLGHAHAGRAGG